MKNGVVTPVSFGTTQIIATTTDGTNISKVCQLTVYPFDINGHWGEVIIEKWMDKKITSGDRKTGMYYPDQYILKSDIMYTINRIISATQKANISALMDVSMEDWYYDDVAKAVKLGYIYPIYATNVFPENEVTREEFMTMLSRALHLKKADQNILNRYEDQQNINPEIRQDVANYIAAFGFAGNDLNGNKIAELIPQNLLTKADAFYFINLAFGDNAFPKATYSTQAIDTRYHWSSEIMEDMIDRKITAFHNITHLFYPDDYILKADVIYTLNRMLQLTDMADMQQYQDLKPTDWYYQDFAKAVKKGYLYPTFVNEIKPVEGVNREELFVMLARALKLPNANLNVLEAYADYDKITPAIKQEVANFIAVFGFSGNKINKEICLIPQNPLTKADTMYFLSKILVRESVVLETQGNQVTATVILSKKELKGNKVPTLEITSGEEIVANLENGIRKDNVITYTGNITKTENLGYVLTGGNLATKEGLPVIYRSVPYLIANYRSKLVLEEPITNTTINGTTMNIQGYAMSEEKETILNILVDEKKIDDGHITRIARQDAIDKEKGYGGSITNPTPGFSIALDTKAYLDGKHTVTAQLVSKATGKVAQETTATVTLKKYKAALQITSPIKDANLRDKISIEGFEVSNIKDVELKAYINGKEIPSNFSRSKSSAVNGFINEYGGTEYNEFPAFYTTLDVSSYQEGTYEVEVQAQVISTHEVISRDKIKVTIYTNEYRGIDVSTFQGKIDWAKVKSTGIDYAMLRVGYRGYGAEGNFAYDSRFYENLKGIIENNIPYGIYFFTQAKNKEEAIEEAEWVLNAIKGYSFKYPIVIDTEASGAPNGTGRADKLTVDERTQVCQAFCERIKQAGFTPMIYASKSWLNNNINMKVLNSYDVWLAHYTNKTDYTGKYQMWQYTSQGSVYGISGNVDLNICYKTY